MDDFSNPSSWGPGAWPFLHCITYTYPEYPNEAQRKQYSQFFLNLGYVLPCPQCRIHYMEYNQQFPCYKFLKNRSTLSTWLYELHNYVNFQLNKPLISDFKTSQQLILRHIQMQKKSKTPR